MKGEIDAEVRNAVVQSYGSTIKYALSSKITYTYKACLYDYFYLASSYYVTFSVAKFAHAALLAYDFVLC